MVEMKTCTLCGKTKDESDFVKHKQMKDGFSYWCKECTRKKAKTYRESPKGIYTNIKGRSKHYRKTGRKVSKPVILSQSEFVNWYVNEKKLCAYCDIPEDKVLLLPIHSKMRRKRLSVDCMDNELGYISGNLVLACGRCNFIKSDIFSYDEMRALAQTYLKPKWLAMLGFFIEKGEENDT